MRSADAALANLNDLIPALETLYTDVHAHPELSMQETRTAGLVEHRLRAAGYDVATHVGKTGVVGLLRNGPGPTVMLRADMDALPIEERTGLPYASSATATDRDGKTVPVMHACGHDMHVAWLAGASSLLAQAHDAWSGTLLVVFQPAEETAQGAQAMIDDGLFERFPKPDVVLGQHAMVGRAGDLRGRAGTITSAADSLQIRLFGRGAHGSMPQASAFREHFSPERVRQSGPTMVVGALAWLSKDGATTRDLEGETSAPFVDPASRSKLVMRTGGTHWST